MNNQINKSLLLVVGAYVTWGLLPIYWSMFSEVAPKTVLLHRVFWSMVFLGLVFLARGRLLSVLRNLTRKDIWCALLPSSVCLGLNWYIYVWALGQGEFVQAGLGYFICPLLTVAFGAIFFREQINRWEVSAVVLMFLSVLLPIAWYGEVPWFGLGLAVSWASYTALKKRFPLPALDGVYLETILILPVLLLLLGDAQAYGVNSSTPLSLWLLFVSAGIVTVVPQLCLVTGVRQVPLKIVGVLQYATPTLMILVSLFMGVKQPSEAELVIMIGVWAGIGVFFLGKRVWRKMRMIGDPVTTRQHAMGKERTLG